MAALLHVADTNLVSGNYQYFAWTNITLSYLTQPGSSSSCVRTEQLSSSPVSSPSPFRAEREIWLGDKFTTNLLRCFRIWFLISPAMAELL